MAHFAKIESDVVVQVIVVNNEVLLNEEGIEEESLGVEFCTNLFGGIWIQTSYNGNFRKKYAGLGDLYDAKADVFYLAKCHEEAKLDKNHDWICTNEAHNVIS